MLSDFEIHVLIDNKVHVYKFLLKREQLVIDQHESPDVQYRSELWDHLFFDNCLNYYNLNYVSEKMCSLNQIQNYQNSP